jgi:hypothetical protein
VLRITADEPAAGALGDGLIAMPFYWQRWRFPYERSSAWSQDIEQRRRWYKACEYVGVEQVRAQVRAAVNRGAGLFLCWSAFYLRRTIACSRPSAATSGLPPFRCGAGHVRKGAVTHKASLGNQGRTEAGDVQVISAGTGIRHTTWNNSRRERGMGRRGCWSSRPRVTASQAVVRSVPVRRSAAP